MVEFVQQEILGIPDDSPEDEDDDNSQDFPPLRFSNESCALKYSFIDLEHVPIEVIQEYFDYPSGQSLSVSYDIATPPPKA